MTTGARLGMTPTARAIDVRRVSSATSNCLLAYLFALFAYSHLLSFLEQPRLSLLLIVMMESLLVLFILIRRHPDETRHSWQTWLSTSAGTFFPLLLRPIDAPADLLAGQSLQIVGAGLQVAALVSLNRSMGLLPAHRGIKSNGLYRFVRHPLYAAYVVTLTGYLINNFSFYNAAIIAIGTSFQMWRIHNEEALLLEYPDYVAFTARTRWRIFPYVW